jgi:flagella synthesis protein FlgN
MTAWQDTLTAMLQAETSSAEALLGCLQEEETALQTLRPEPLEAIINRKLLLLKDMTQHAINRTELLDALKLPSDSKGLHQLISSEGEPLQGLWSRLLEFAAQLEQQNQINGSSIQLCKQRSQMALEILTQPVDSGKTYGKQGYAQSDSVPYTSIKA